MPSLNLKVVRITATPWTSKDRWGIETRKSVHRLLTDDNTTVERMPSVETPENEGGIHTSSPDTSRLGIGFTMVTNPCPHTTSSGVTHPIRLPATLASKPFPKDALGRNTVTARLTDTSPIDTTEILCHRCLLMAG